MKKLDPATIIWKQGNPQVEGEYLVLHEGGRMSKLFRHWYEGCDWVKPDINYDNNSISWWTNEGYNAETFIGNVIGFYDINRYYPD